MGVDDFEAETEALHRVVADDFVVFVGDVEQFEFETEGGFAEVEIVAQRDALVNVAGHFVGGDILR